MKGARVLRQTSLNELFRRPLGAGSIQRSVVGAISTGILAQFALIVSGVLFARLLGPQGRGELALIVLLPLLVYQVGSLGVPIACAYFIAETPPSGLHILNQLRAVVPLQLLMLVVSHSALVATLVWPHAALRAAALISLAWTPALLLQDYGLAFLQGQRRFLAFNALRGIPAAINVIVALIVLALHVNNLAFIVTLLVALVFGAGWITAGVAYAGASRQTGAAGLASSPSTSQLLRFGAKSLLGSAYPIETFRLDQLIVALSLSAYDLGLYVVALSFMNLPRFISQSIGTVAYPYIAAQRDPERQAYAMWRFVGFTVVVTATVVLLLELVLPMLIRVFFGAEFVSAERVSRVLLLAAIFLSARRILGDVMKGAGHPGASSIAEGVSIGVLVLAMVFLARAFDLLGVAIALLLAAVVSLGVLVALARRGQSHRVGQVATELLLEEEAIGSVAP